MTKKCVSILVLLLVCAATGWTEPITVPNYSFELPADGKHNMWDAGTNGKGTFTDVPGWTSDTPAADSGVETSTTGTGAYAGFLMVGDPSVWQLTDHTIGAGEIYTLSVDAWITYQGTSFTMSLYYNNSGTRVTLATATKTITSTKVTYTLTAKANDVTASIGKKIGIEMKATDSDGFGWEGMDNVRLDVAYVEPISPANGAVRVDRDADLSWTKPSGWTSDLYFGPENEPNLITTPTYKRLSQSTATTWDPGTMAYLTVYYWRVDAYEPNSVSPYIPTKHVGPVWSFTTIPQSPTITVDPASQTVAAGTNAVFTVTAVSTDTYKWYKEGVSTALATGANYTVSGNTLTVLSVDVSDEGYYYCVVSNNQVTDTDESTHVQLLTKRLIGWWKLDGNLNDSVTDVVPDATAHPGTMTDPNYAAGVDAGQAMEFFEDSYAQITGTETIFNFHPQGITVSAWVKTSETNYGGVVSKADRTTPMSGWTLQHNGNSISMSLRSVENVSNSNGEATVNASLTDGEWHLVAGTFDPATGMVRVYGSYVENGVNKLGYSEGGPYVVLTSTEALPLLIGTEMNALGEDQVYFAGKIDDVRLYSYALTGAEIATSVYYPVKNEKVCALSEFQTQMTFDFNGDCEINLEDFAPFAAQWLQTGFYPL